MKVTMAVVVALSLIFSAIHFGSENKETTIGIVSFRLMEMLLPFLLLLYSIFNNNIIFNKSFLLHTPSHHRLHTHTKCSFIPNGTE